jgi:D-alanyl-D-alanine carboxypeptidase
MRHGPDDRVIFASAANEVASRLATDRGRAELGVIYGDVAWSASIGRGGGLQESDSRFLFYSFTKTIVAAALLRLVANNTLELDAPFTTALSDTFGLPSMTLRQMLQHASGLPDYGKLQAYHDGVRKDDEPWSEADFLRRTEASRLQFAPGRGWAYSNIGYMLLRLALAEIGRTSFASVLRRQIVEPLGIRSASVPETKEALAPFTFGPSPYLGGVGMPVPVFGRYDPRWIATGVVGATPLDAARLLHGLMAGALLPRGLLDEMTAAVPIGNPWPGDHGKHLATVSG